MIAIKPPPGRTAILLTDIRRADTDETVFYESVRWDGWTVDQMKSFWADRAVASGWMHRWVDGALVVDNGHGKIIRHRFVAEA